MALIANARVRLYKFLFVIACLSALAACGGSSSKSSDSTGEVETYFVTGAIIAEEHSTVDADVQQFFGVQNINNDFAEAQTLENPSVLGGYISATEGSYDNNIAFSIDAADVYQVNLVAGQEIYLNVFYADPTLDNINVRFRLFDLDDTSSAVGTVLINQETSASITTPEDGEYYIFVDSEEIFNPDPILYTLNISQSVAGSTPSVAQSVINPNADFVPGEVLIKYREPPANFSANLVSGADVSVRGYSVGGVSVGHINDFDDDFVHATLNLQPLSNLPNGVTFGAASTVQAQELKWQTANAINEIRQDPNVLYAEPNYIRRANAVTVNDPEFSRQWNLALIDAPAAWEVSTGEDVVIAVIDSGIAGSHEDLAGNILRRQDDGSIEGWDFVGDTDSAGDGDGYDSNPEDEAGNFHGSHVAGIASAVADNNEGMAGVAFNSSIMPLRVLGIDGFGSDADIVQAIRYASGLSSGATRNAEQRADIINMSLGSPEQSAALQSAVAEAVALNIIVIAAAGNDSSSAADYFPAGYPGVVGVSSVSQDRRLSSFSNFGVNIDVAAPGGNGISDNNNDGFRDGVISTVSANNYAEYQGTSMAAPHVAGVAALMKSVNPSVNRVTFNDALENGDLTEDIGSENFFGNGLINAAKAMEWAGEEISASLNAFPPDLSFTGSATLNTITLSNPGQGTVAVNSVSDSEPWLAIAADSVDVNGLGTYSVQVDRSGLAQGSSFSGTITINYSIDGGAAQEDTIPVFMSVSSPTGTDRVGELLVSLFRKSDLENAEISDAPFIETFVTVNASFSGGQYRFAIPDVPPGEYIIEASTNNDSDGFVNDSGEAVGGFPLYAEPAVITVSDSDLVGINFGVSYRTLFNGDRGATSAGTSTRKPALIRRPASTVVDDSLQSAR